MNKSNNRDRVIHALILSFVLSVSIVPAQSPDGTLFQDAATRVRRVDATQPPDIPPPPTSSLEQDTEVSSEAKIPTSDIEGLREQIDAAGDPQEKLRLHLKLVDYLVQADMKQQAIAELILLSREDRFNPQGFYNIGNALARLGSADEAEKAYRKAIGQRKGRYSRALNNLGVVLLRQGRWDDASEALLSALRLENFRYAEASYNLGRLYAARGETDLAIREWRRAIAVDPEHSAAERAIADARRGSGIAVARPSGRKPAVTATSTGKPAVAAKGSTELRPVENIKPTNPPRSAPSAMRVLTVDPETYDLLQRARTARDRGRNDEAVRDYRRVISRMGGYFPPANLELSYALITLKRNDEALASLLLLAHKDGVDFPISHYHLGRLYELKGELKLAEEHYSRAATLYGEQNSQFLLDVSRVREKLGDFSGALTAMEEYVATVDREGQRSDWSEERIIKLRQHVTSLKSSPKQ